MATVTLTQIARYLASYIEAYHREYRAFVNSPPTGGGYPPLQVSPYLYSSQLFCLVARDGYAVADFSKQPEYQWEIAGGPALLVDLPESRTPAEIVALLKAKGIWGKPTGLYRIVAQSGIPDDIWRGDLGRPVAKIDVQVGTVQIRVEQYDTPWISLVQRLTFGAYGLILNVNLPEASSPFWRPHITRDLGFVPADRNNKRFFHYLELGPHLDEAAWDERSIPTRVAVDLRRDFAYAFVVRHQTGGGTISFGAPNVWVECVFRSIRPLIPAQTVRRFRLIPST